MKKIQWHLEMALLRRRMRPLHDAPPMEPLDEPATTMPHQLSGFAPFRETTAFTDLQ